jgi:integrase
MATLTDVKIRNSRPTKAPYRLPAGKGLYLEVRPSGSKLWRYRYRIDGRENLFAMGEFSDRPPGEKPAEVARRHAAGKFTLAEAQMERVRCRDLVKQGIHPVHEKNAAKAARQDHASNTFEAVAKEWVEANRPLWSPRYRVQVERTFAEYVFKEIGSRPLRGVTSSDLLRLVKAVNVKAPTTALLVRQWTGAVFRYAVANLKAEGDPTIAIKKAIARPAVKSKTPLELKQIPAMVKAIDAYEGGRPAAIAVNLLLYLWVRPSELRTASWSEFDFAEGIWRIPADRMKMRLPHLVPLSTQAIALLEELRAITGGGPLLFPNRRDSRRPMAPTSLHNALDAMGYAGKFSPHAFRATASTILNEAGYRPDLIERQLAHKERNVVRASYNKAEYLPERRQMMQQWADMIDAAGAAKVVPINAKAAKAAA